MDSWLEKLEYEEPTWEEEVKRVEKVIKNSQSTALKGIPGPDSEPGQEESSPSIVQSEPSPPQREEGSSINSGDSTSVFTNLAPGSEGVTMEAEESTGNSKVSVSAVGYTVKLPPYPNVSCRITLTGDTILSFHWDRK